MVTARSRPSCRRPCPPDRLRFFFKDDERRRLRERLVLTQYLALKRLDFLRVKRLFIRTRRLEPYGCSEAPLLQLRFVNALATQELAERGIADFARFDDDTELFNGRPTLRGLVHDAHCTSLFQPTRERRLVQTNLGGKGVRGDRVRRKHLANHMGPEGLGVHGHGLISLLVPRVAITPSALRGRCDNYADTGGRRCDRGLETALDSDTRSEGGVLLHATGGAWLAVAAHAATIASGPSIARRTFQCVSTAMPS